MQRTGSEGGHTGQIAVKVIDDYGDEVLQVFAIDAAALTSATTA